MALNEGGKQKIIALEGVPDCRLWRAWSTPLFFIPGRNPGVHGGVIRSRRARFCTYLIALRYFFCCQSDSLEEGIINTIGQTLWAKLLDNQLAVSSSMSECNYQ